MGTPPHSQHQKRRLGRTMRRPRFAALAIDVAEDGPPSEFRLFRQGVNTSTNGDFLFDEAAAALVMAQLAKHDVDLMIDLEHLSLDEESPAFDPDARGYCRLEVREGELWAVNVAWTPDGARRLTEKTQRFVSPFFAYDEESRVTRIVNIALTAMPATDSAQALVAARQRRQQLSDGVSHDEMRTAINAAIRDAVGLNGDEWDGPWIRDVFETTAVYEHEGKVWEVSYSYNAGVVALGSPVEVQIAYTPIQSPTPQPTTGVLRTKRKKMTDEQKKAALEAIKNGDGDKALKLLEQQVVDGGAPAEPAPLAEDLEEDPKPAALAESDDDQEKEELSEDEPTDAEARMAIAITGLKTPGEAWAELTRRNRVAVDVEEREKKLAQDRRAFEATHRDELVVQLVQLGESPATAWADPVTAEDRDKRKPAEPWASMPIATLRDRVEKLGGQPATGEAPRPPAKKGQPTHRLSRDEKVAMDLRMGLVARKRVTVREGSIVRFGVQQPESAQEGGQ
jgi:Mu-like prophage I protein